MDFNSLKLLRVMCDVIRYCNSAIFIISLTDMVPKLYMMYIKSYIRAIENKAVVTQPRCDLYLARELPS